MIFFFFIVTKTIQLRIESVGSKVIFIFTFFNNFKEGGFKKNAQNTVVVVTEKS